MAARTHPGQENEAASERRRPGGVDDIHQALICHRTDLACRLEEAATANSAGDVHGEENRATRAELRRPERAGVGDIARTDLNGGRKQITRLRRITRDAQDRRPAFRELAGDLQPGSAGAADNAVRSLHAVTAVSARVGPASCLQARSLRCAGDAVMLISPSFCMRWYPVAVHIELVWSDRRKILGAHIW